MQPQRRVEKDPLDTIIKGLSIAGTVFNIKDGMDKAELLKAQKAQDAEKFAMEKTKFEDEQAGVLSAKDKIQYGDKYTFSDIQTPGAFEGKQRTENGLASIFMTPKPKERDPLADAYRTAQIDSLKTKNNGEAAIFKNLPKDSQELIQELTKKKASQMATGNMVNELYKQLTDPDIPENQKIAMSLEQLKLMNSTLGPDALGAGETERVSKFLTNEPSPSVGKWSFGPDIKGFTSQLENARKRNTGSIEQLTKQIDTAYGRVSESPVMEKKPVSSNIQEAAKRELLKRQGIKAGISLQKRGGS